MKLAKKTRFPAMRHFEAVPKPEIQRRTPEPLSIRTVSFRLREWSSAIRIVAFPGDFPPAAVKCSFSGWMQKSPRKQAESGIFVLLRAGGLSHKNRSSIDVEHFTGNETGVFSA